VSIRDAGGPPILDDFVEPFAGRQCYTVFDLFWGFDARRVHPDSRDLTAFATPLGLLRLTCMPMDIQILQQNFKMYGFYSPR